MTECSKTVKIRDGNSFESLSFVTVQGLTGTLVHDCFETFILMLVPYIVIRAQM
jgi:hypothetical protein